MFMGSSLLAVGAHFRSGKGVSVIPGLSGKPSAGAPRSLPRPPGQHSTLGESQGQDNYSIPVPSSVDAGVIVYAVIMT